PLRVLRMATELVGQERRADEQNAERPAVPGDDPLDDARELRAYLQEEPLHPLDGQEAGLHGALQNVLEPPQTGRLPYVLEAHRVDHERGHHSAVHAAYGHGIAQPRLGAVAYPRESRLVPPEDRERQEGRSEEHTSELQS